MKVLIVDDEILVRKGLSLGVEWEQLGFEHVFEASNGIEALKIVKDQAPELMFTDIRMPKMDGLELIDKVKAIYPDTVILVLSCINDSDVIREALKFNKAIDYIPKLSMSTEELKRVVLKAKSYIKKDEAEEESIYYTVVELEVYKKLRNALDDYDKESVIEILKQVFNKAMDLGIKKDGFMEWYELFSLFSTKLKEVDSDITKIIIGKQNGYQFLDEVLSMDELQKKFLMFVDYYFEFMEKSKGVHMGVEVKHAIKFVRENYSASIKLSDIADTIGLNESYLSRLFKKQVGVNFSDYVNQTRLSKAKELLNENQLPIYEIARQVGYNSESYFSRIFKQYEGLSPKQYMNERV